MNKICDYCDSTYDDSLSSCPHCGAANDYVRRSDGVPETIEELRRWYEEHHLPPEETTRFFIGKDYKGPQAFGIYEDSGDFIVYKNKSDGSRAVRYRGSDEAYAVNELYTKLKETIAEQKSHNSGSYSSPSRNLKKTSKLKNWQKLLIAITILLLVCWIFGDKNSTRRGYYTIDDSCYYYVNGDWYQADKSGWYPADVPVFNGDINDYYDGYSYDSSYAEFNFDNSYYADRYDSNDSYDNDWDDDYDWDAGDDWDIGGDWDTDW